MHKHVASHLTKMRSLIYILILTTISCQSQTKRNIPSKIVGGPCEGCEAIFEYGNNILNVTDTLPGYIENEPKIKITGTVFKKDGKTPANNVILYIYHTNRNGIYEKKGNEKGWAKRHGFIRGWIKTDAQGTYTFLTFRPVAYPGGREPEHIHMTVKEPNKNEYYIDDIMFADDPKLTPYIIKRLKKRAGSGVVELKKDHGMLTAKRTIVLGLNIPNYD